MRERASNAEIMVGELRAEMSEQFSSHNAKFDQLVTMFQDLMRRYEEREGDVSGATQARRAEVRPNGGSGSGEIQSSELEATRAQGNPAEAQSVLLRSDARTETGGGDLPIASVSQENAQRQVFPYRVGPPPVEEHVPQQERGDGRPEPPGGQGAVPPPRAAGIDSSCASGEARTRKKEAESVKLQALPRAPAFRNWKMAVRNEVAAASGDPHNAFKWIIEVDSGKSIDEFDGSGAFPSLDAKLAAAITKIVSGNLSHKIHLAMETRAKTGRMLTGRQMLLMVYDHYKISEVEGALLDFEDLTMVKLQGDDLQGFLTDWENVLAVIAEQPSQTVLETLFRKQLTKSVSLREQMSYYERLDAGHADRNYDFLLSIVRKRLEQIRRDRTRDELHHSLARKGKVIPAVGARGDLSEERPQSPKCP